MNTEEKQRAFLRALTDKALRGLFWESCFAIQRAEKVETSQTLCRDVVQEQYRRSGKSWTQHSEGDLQNILYACEMTSSPEVLGVVLLRASWGAPWWSDKAVPGLDEEVANKSLRNFRSHQYSGLCNLPTDYRQTNTYRNSGEQPRFLPRFSRRGSEVVAGTGGNDLEPSVHTAERLNTKRAAMRATVCRFYTDYRRTNTYRNSGGARSATMAAQKTL